MRTAALWVGVFSILISGGLARAQTSARPSFAESLADAEPVGELASLLAPLFDECGSSDEVEARQCRVIRDLAIEEMKGETFVALGDDAALQWEPFDPVEKKLTLDVEGCLACARPLAMNGSQGPRVFVTSRVPKAIRAGRAIGLDVGFHDVAQPDRAQAAKWRRTMEGRLLVQFLFRVGPVWKSGAFEGVTFVPVAHRLFDRCTGEVVAVDPPLAAGQSVARAEPLRDARCPETDAERQAREEAALPEQLTPRQINRALEAARARVRDCAGEFQASGTATVRLAIGGDGKLASARVLPPYEKTPAGYCIHSALAGTTFPRFRGEPMVLEVPLPLP